MDRYRSRGCVQQLAAEFELRLSLPAGEKAEVTDPYKSTRQHMQKEAAQKLLHVQLHHTLFVAMRRVSPPEYHLPLGEFNQSMVGDGNAVGVVTQVLQHLFRTAEGPLDVHYPVVAMALP